VSAAEARAKNVFNVTALIGTHLGTNAIGFAAVKNKV
jgi:fatty acid-binding protein DegV